MAHVDIHAPIPVPDIIPDLELNPAPLTTKSPPRSEK